MAGDDERLRLFLALRLPDETVETLAEWQARELTGRLVPTGNLHVTLAFLGSRPAGDLAAILGVLERAAHDVGQPRFVADGYRETRSVGMLTLDDQTGTGAELAARVQGELAELGIYRPEARPWLPHVSVVRFRERPLLSPPLPEVGSIVTSDAAAFLSRLHPSGARYEVLKSFRLGG